METLLVTSSRHAMHQFVGNIGTVACLGRVQALLPLPLATAATLKFEGRLIGLGPPMTYGMPPSGGSARGWRLNILP
jgi:hypothetical protein